MKQVTVKTHSSVLKWRAGFRLSPDQSASFYFSWRLFQALQMETVSTQVKFQLTREMVCCSRLPPSGEYCVVYMI